MRSRFSLSYTWVGRDPNQLLWPLPHRSTCAEAGILEDQRTGHEDGPSVNMLIAAVTRDVMSSPTPSVCDRRMGASP